MSKVTTCMSSGRSGRMYSLQNVHIGRFDKLQSDYSLHCLRPWMKETDFSVLQLQKFLLYHFPQMFSKWVRYISHAVTSGVIPSHLQVFVEFQLHFILVCWWKYPEKCRPFCNSLQTVQTVAVSSKCIRILSDVCATPWWK